MARQLSFVPQVVPADWQPQASTSKSISTPVTRTLLPAGPAFLPHARRVTSNRSFEADDKFEEEERRLAASKQEAADGAEDDLGVGDEEETEELLSLDPKEWKKQDHYAVLGLSKLRYLATDAQIKITHRKKVLKHHPDKKANSGDSNNDAFFKCIQKAVEVLSNPEKRRQFDSVDPYYEALEEDTPSASDVLSDKPQSFFDVFEPIFQREARFSKKNPVLLLGVFDDPKEKVEAFYDFWYNFDSWRSFEYLDKEVNEGNESRDDKRYVEKKNKSERARRKKEDTARLRKLVDRALSLDPRIARIKSEEKQAREAKKKGKAGGASSVQKQKEDEERLKADEAKRLEEEEKAKAEAKKSKAAAATAAKKARRQQRADDGVDTPAS